MMTPADTVTARTSKYPTLNVRRWRVLLLGLVAVALWVLPAQLLQSPYYLRLITFAWINAVIALGLNMAVGVAGQINLGQAALVGVSAYVTAMFIRLAGWAWLPSAVVGVAAAVSTGMALGWVSNRLRGPYLAIVTLGANVVFQLLLFNEVDLTGGPMGLRVSAPQVFGTRVSAPAVYMIVFGCLVLLYALCRLVYHSKLGRNFRATRDDETVARIMGINTVRAKVQACMLCGLCAGLGGVLFLLSYRFIAPAEFAPTQSFRYLAMVVIGGLGNLPGAILGALVVTLVPEFLRMWPGLWDVVLGSSILVVLLLFPKGLGFISEYLGALLSKKSVEQRWTGEIGSTGGTG